MTEVVEENVTPPTQGEVPASEAPTAEATPKTPKTDAERIKQVLTNGQNKPKYQMFVEWVSTATDGEITVDYDSAVMTAALLNEFRQRPEFKAAFPKGWKAEGGAKADVLPKTPEEIREYAKKAAATAERAAKTKAAAEARAERAARALAELEAEEAGDTEDIDDLDAELVSDDDETDEVEDDAF